MNKEKLKEFLLFIKNKTSLNALELIEKDFYLNFLLSKLSLGKYAFKGGTCLSKVYLNYHRFSEDLDFTFINQDIFKHKSIKQMKKICKEKINEFGKQLQLKDFDFVFDKSDKSYIEIGSNNKLATFKLYYKSLFSDIKSFIKIQINFVDILYFPIKMKNVKFISDFNISDEEKIYFSEFLKFYHERKIKVYDIREIMIEKLRSLLTRRVTRTRDIIDLFFIFKKYKLRLGSYLEEIKGKINFALVNYQKYRENYKLISGELDKLEISKREIDEIVIEKVDYNEFNKFMTKLKKFLKEFKKLEEVK